MAGQAERSDSRTGIHPKALEVPGQSGRSPSPAVISPSTNSAEVNPTPSSNLEERLLARLRELEDGMNAKMQKLEKLLAKKDNEEAPLEWRSLNDPLHSFADCDIDPDSKFQLSQDIYSIFATYKWKTWPFFLSVIVVFCFQIALLLLLIFDQIGSDDNNVFGIPANVEGSVRASQFLALFIALYSQDDLRVGIEGMAAGMPAFYQYPHKKDESDPFQAASPLRWKFAYFFRFLQGFIGVLASLVLLIQSETVFDVLLNFLGVEFIAGIDDLVFELGSKAYFGPKMKKAVDAIEETHFARKEEQMERTSNKFLDFWGFAHVIGVIVMLAAMFGVLVFIAVEQDDGEFAVTQITVEFGDEVLPFLGTFSGCYKVSEDGSNHHRRLIYEQVGPGESGGRLGYCQDFKQPSDPGWSFYVGASGDPCDDYVIRSSATKTFDILEAGETQWFTNKDRPVGLVQMEKSINPSKECGIRSDDSCAQLVLTEQFSGQEGSLLFDKLSVNSNYQDRLFDSTLRHSIYLGNTSSEIVLFTGRRWVLTDVARMPSQVSSYWNGSAWNNTEGLKDFFYKERMFRSTVQTKDWVLLVSNIVGASDLGTPEGLRWYNPRYESNVTYDSPSWNWRNRSWARFPFADVSRSQDATMRCAVCDKDNPCAYNGTCNENNGTCACAFRATGPLCLDAPLGDGVCDVYFNTAEFDYDGGDCCAGTCDGPLCGSGGLVTVFGKDFEKSQSGAGFDNCIDPSMVLFTIALTRDDVGNLAENLWATPMTISCGNKRHLWTPQFSKKLVELPNETLTKVIHVTAGVNCELKRAALEGTAKNDTFSSTLSAADVGETDEAFGIKIYFGNSTDDAAQVRQINNTALDLQWEVPSDCLQNLFTKQLTNISFDDSTPQGEAITSLSTDGLSTVLCEMDTDLVLERYALTVFNKTSRQLGSINSKEHQCYGWGSGAIEISCDNENRVVGIKSRGGLQGSLPSEIEYLSALSSIEILGLDGRLEQLPTQIGNLKNLQTLKIETIEGTLPSELFKISTLKEMSFYDSKRSLSKPYGLRGSISTEFAKLKELRFLNLGANTLTGTIPSELAELTELTLLHLSTNELNGTIPSEMLGNFSLLEWFTVDTNKLTGTIPTEIGELQSLTRLDLSRNEFTGQIPTEIGMLRNMTFIYAIQNSLTGLIPELPPKLNGKFETCGLAWKNPNSTSDRIEKNCFDNADAFAICDLRNNCIEG